MNFANPLEVVIMKDSLTRALRFALPWFGIMMGILVTHVLINRIAYGYLDTYVVWMFSFMPLVMLVVAFTVGMYKEYLRLRLKKAD